MSGKVKVSQDGSISFSTTENIPSSPKKFRKSPEIAAFYKFVFEHDLQKEAYEIVHSHWVERKHEKKAKPPRKKK
ncbi:MAG: hypothetical protein CL677_06770 [Bdellovibrionaceae bacterium]|nr:hypothetical protein [Pseudobdellovibrionaceae bacterium]